MNVVPITDHPQMAEIEARNKRRAIQIVAQLPENGAEALSVLALAEQLVRSFLLTGGL